jgi:hypothetical protein
MLPLLLETLDEPEVECLVADVYAEMQFIPSTYLAASDQLDRIVGGPCEARQSQTESPDLRSAVYTGGFERVMAGDPWQFDSDDFEALARIVSPALRQIVCAGLVPT